jgi:hypothetical protein
VSYWSNGGGKADVKTTARSEMLLRLFFFFVVELII